MDDNKQSAFDIYSNTISINTNKIEAIIEFSLETPQQDGTVNREKIGLIRLNPQLLFEMGDLINNLKSQLNNKDE